MVLSNLTQNFVVYFGPNFFYPEVVQRWMPMIKRLMLPYMTVEDYMNAQIQSFELPAVSMNPLEQQSGRYMLKKRQSQTLDEAIDKSLTITFKLTEGYTSYFIMRQQMDLFYQIGKVKPLYWSPITVDLLDDMGNAIITYEQEQITPDNISELQLSYAAQLGKYNTFTIGMKYNYLNMWYLDSVSQKMVLENNLTNEAETRQNS